MYCAIYNRSKSHVANVIITQFSIVKKRFDNDSSTFIGICDTDITSGLIFVFCTDRGTKRYSGFMKNIVQKGKSVSFRGLDFRSIFDTEIMLDYTQTNGASGYTAYYLESIFDKAKTLVNNQASSTFTLSFTMPASDTTNTSWIANYDGSYFFVKARSFLKLYLAYYSYFITSTFNESNNKIDFVFQKEPTTALFWKLKDFIFDKKSTDIALNRVIATIKYETSIDNTNKWVGPAGSSTYWDAQPSSNRATSAATGDGETPSENATTYNVGFAMRVSDGGLPATYQYWQCVPNFRTRPTTLAWKEYHLGLDNIIYEGSTITNANRIYPVQSKIYESEYLNKAQFAAISDLVNSRYVENITITKDNLFNPIDISDYFDIGFYMVRLYDDAGTYKDLPVGEIEWNENDYMIRLGFKKTLFTDIVKDTSRLGDGTGETLARFGK